MMYLTSLSRTIFRNIAILKSFEFEIANMFGHKNWDDATLPKPNITGLKILITTIVFIFMNQDLSSFYMILIPNSYKSYKHIFHF